MTTDVSTTDWKEVGITAGVTLVTAFAGSLAAVMLVQLVIIPAINKAKEKKAASKDKTPGK